MNKASARLNRQRKRTELDALRDRVQLLEARLQAAEPAAINPPPALAATPPGLCLQYDRELTAKVLTKLGSMLGVPPGLSTGGSGAESADERLAQYVQQRPFYVVGVTGHSYPIVYASPAFAALTGHPLHAVIGRNCGFLHGPLTDKEEVCAFLTHLLSHLNIMSLSRIAYRWRS